MSKGRHRAGHVPGDPRTTTGSRKAAPGVRKAPPAARKASPTRVGGAKVAGRRVADGEGRPGVLTALGSGEKILALLPLAILSLASVAGLTGDENGDPATSPSPTDSSTAAGSVGHVAAPRQVISRGDASLARTPTSDTPTSQTASPVVTGEDTGSDAVDEENAPMRRSPAAGSLVEAPARADRSAEREPTDRLAEQEPTDRRAEQEPTDRPADEDPTTPVPTGAPTATPDTADSDSLTNAEATARCLESGISTAEVVSLRACVEELLG